MRQNSENGSAKKPESPKSNDARNRYVLRHITDALLTLMVQRPFQEITISEICQTAEVGRASFYRNYDSKQAVLEKHLALLLQEWGAEFEAHGDPAYFSESLLRHYDRHRDFYLLLYRQGLSSLVYESIRAACQVAEASCNLERYSKSMFAGLLFGWIDEWMRQGMPESPEEILMLTTSIALKDSHESS